MSASSPQSPGPAIHVTPPARASLPFVRYRWIWIVMLLLAYLSSYLWLKLGLIWVPLVIFRAPLGLVYAMAQEAYHYPSIVEISGTMIVLHLVFWSLYFTGVIGAKRLDIRLLRTIFIVVAIVILLTLYGCSAMPPINIGC